MAKKLEETTGTNALAALGDLGDMITSERPAGSDAVTGAEGITKDDILLPRLGIAQKTSPEIDPTSPKKITGLEFTDLYNSLTKKVYGKGPLYFVILRREDKPRWIEFNPLEEGGGIKDRNVFAGDPRTEFGPNGEKPLATMFYDYLILILNDLDASDPLTNVVAMSLKSSGIVAAKNLNMLIKQRGSKMICKGVYELNTGHDTDKKSGGVYAIYKFNNKGWLKADSAIEKMAIEMYESWKDRDLVIDEEQAVDEFDPAKMEPTGATAGM